MRGHWSREISSQTERIGQSKFSGLDDLANDDEASTNPRLQT